MKDSLTWAASCVMPGCLFCPKQRLAGWGRTNAILAEKVMCLGPYAAQPLPDELREQHASYIHKRLQGKQTAGIMGKDDD